MGVDTDARRRPPEGLIEAAAKYLGTPSQGASLRHIRTHDNSLWRFVPADGKSVVLNYFSPRVGDDRQKRVDRYVAFQKRVQAFGGSVARVIPPARPNALPLPTTRASEGAEQNPAFVCLEDLGELRQPTSPNDARAALAAAGRTAAAMQLAVAAAGPWDTFPDNGPDYWRKVAIAAHLRGEKSGPRQIFEAADLLGAIGLSLPLEPGLPGSCIEHFDLSGNVEMRDVGTAVVVDLGSCGVEATTDAFEQVERLVKEFGDSLGGVDEARRIARTAFDETLENGRRMVQPQGVPIRDPEAAYNCLLELRSAVEGTQYLRDRTTKLEDIPALLESLNSLAPAFAPELARPVI